MMWGYIYIKLYFARVCKDAANGKNIEEFDEDEIMAFVDGETTVSSLLDALEELMETVAEAGEPGVFCENSDVGLETKFSDFGVGDVDKEYCLVLCVKYANVLNVVPSK